MQQRAPLVTTSDPELLDDVLRLAAAAQIDVDVATEVASARSGWTAAPLLIVGKDAAADVDGLHLPRRPGVVMVSRSDERAVWRQAVLLGAERVAVLPSDDAWLISRFGQLGDSAREPAAVLCVLGARGGGGATSLALALGITASSLRLRTTLVDLDPLGPGLDSYCGTTTAQSATSWRDLAQTRGRISGAALVEGLPTSGGLARLTWPADFAGPPRPGAVAAAVDALAEVCDLVVVDLPRALDEYHAEAICRAARVLVVTPRDLRSVAAAARLAQCPYLQRSDLRLVTRGPAPGGLDGASIADATGIPLLTDVAAEPSIDADLETGLPPGTRRRSKLRKASLAVLGDLGIGAVT